MEKAVEIQYPASFKEFVGLYGGSVWFDNVVPIFIEAKSDAEVKDYLRSVDDNLKPLQNKVFDEKLRPIKVPIYPEKGGLFPFLVDYSSNLFCWETKDEDPEKWPVYCWLRGPTFVLRKTTIAKMILEWLDHKPQMVKVWGDIRDYEPERICLTETGEVSEKPKKKARTRKKK